MLNTLVVVLLLAAAEPETNAGAAPAATTQQAPAESAAPAAGAPGSGTAPDEHVTVEAHVRCRMVEVTGSHSRQRVCSTPAQTSAQQQQLERNMEYMRQQEIMQETLEVKRSH